MLLRAGDDARPYQSEGRKAKSTAIDATGHAEYNEEDAPLRFPLVARLYDLAFFNVVSPILEYRKVVKLNVLARFFFTVYLLSFNVFWRHFILCYYV